MKRIKGKKKIRRRPGVPQKKYFTDDTQRAIVEYQNCIDIVNKCTNLLLASESDDFETFVREAKEKEIARVKRIAKKKGENPDLIKLDIRSFRKQFLPENYKEMKREECEVLIEENQDKAWKIYTARIQPAFDKLVENLIFLHNFKGRFDSYEDLKNDTVSALYEKLPNFDESKGTKAFSYYNIVAKNSLIIESKKRSKDIVRNVSLDDKDSLGDEEKESLEQHCTLPSPDDQVIEKENIQIIKKMLKEVQGRLVNPIEIKCMNSIQDLFDMANQLPMLKKRAVFTYIREMTDVTPKQLTTAMSNIKKRYREIRGEDEFWIF